MRGEIPRWAICPAACFVHRALLSECWPQAMSDLRPLGPVCSNSTSCGQCLSALPYHFTMRATRKGGAYFLAHRGEGSCAEYPMT